MIAIKATGRVVVETSLGPHGTPVVAEILRPEGLEGRREALALEAPRAGAATLWLVDDDAVPPSDARRARPADVPVRTDLPKDHPLYGRRALTIVPAGWPDAALDADGRVVPLDLKTGELVAEAAAEELATGELGEVGHGRR